MKICVVIPHYDHLTQFEQFLPALTTLNLPLLVVDDASPADVADGLEKMLAAEAPGTMLVKHEANTGKGGAVMTGLRAALDAGFTHALQIDADGQHDIADVPAFLNAAAAYPDSVICGEPQFDESISSLRYYARYLTLSLTYLESLSTQIRDALCGFRLYPLRSIVNIIDSSNPGERMAFDPEILVRAVWAGIPLHYVPVHVIYPPDGRSHFRYFGDNVEISWMHTRLLLGMLIRLPSQVWSGRTRKQQTP